MLAGYLVQGNDAARHDRTSHHGESWITPHAHHPQGSSTGLWQLQLQRGEPTRQEQEVFDVVGQAKHRDFPLGAGQSVQGQVS